MADHITNRQNWVLGKINSDIILDKREMLHSNISQMLNKTLRMFKYENLPETIPAKDLELLLQVGGYAIVTKVKDELYAFTGGLGGEPNPYYLPTLAVVANPALRYNESLKIGEDCVVVLNDDLYQGLMPLNNKYGAMLTEAEISLRFAIINARIPALISADNESSKETAEKFINDITEGRKYGVISSNEFFDGIKSHDFYKQQYIKDIIESIQYIKGSWYNELGINAAFNMKREAINEAEATLNEDILYPSVDNMLERRKLGVDAINKKYGTNITVELDSVWAKTRRQDELIEDKTEAEIKDISANAEEVVVDEND